MNKMFKEFNSAQFLLLLFVIFPILTYSAEEPRNFKGFIMIVVAIITAVLPVIVLLALLYFLWGLVQYLKNAGENRAEAQHMMINGVIGFFVMASVWGFVGILSATFGTDSKLPIDSGMAGSYLLDDGNSIKNILKEHQNVLRNDLQDSADLEDLLRYHSNTLKYDLYELNNSELTALKKKLETDQDLLKDVLRYQGNTSEYDFYQKEQDLLDDIERQITEIDGILDGSYRDPNVPGHGSSHESNEYEEYSETKVPSWFKKALPWNWF